MGAGQAERGPSPKAGCPLGAGFLYPGLPLCWPGLVRGHRVGSRIPRCPVPGPGQGLGRALELVESGRF